MTYRYFAFILFCLATLMGQSAQAQDVSYLGYCDGRLASATEGHATGVAGTDVDIELAIRLPQSVLSVYAGCRITAVKVGVPAATEYPTALTAWVRTEQNGGNIIEGKKTSPKEGWTTIATSKSYVITGEEEELWVGVSYHQAAKLNVISFAGPTHPDGAWMGKSGKWNDYSGKAWGSLSIEAVVEGSVPTHNLMITHADTKNRLVKIGDSFTVTGTVKNLATTTAERPFIRYSIGEETVGTYTFPRSIAYRETADFSIAIPTDVLTDDISTDVTLELCWADGSVDEGPDDNIVRLAVDFVKELFYRTMVVEEGTGAWCGWCVYGIVGLREMKRLYPDTFIGIAVHNGDSYALSDYTNWIGGKLPSGYPGCIINRTGGEQLPRFAELQQAYDGMPNIADAGITVDASASGNSITFESAVRFFYDMTGTDFRVVYVITENKLPIIQKNYYTGGARGEMGGFENLPGDCNIEVDDVARGIFPSIKGTQGRFPSRVVKGKTYTDRLTVNLPAYRKAENLEVIALLLNGKTGEIVQGTKNPFIYGLNAERPEGIMEVPASASADESLYDLSGRMYSVSQTKCGAAPQHGLYIHKDRVVLK